MFLMYMMLFYLVPIGLCCTELKNMFSFTFFFCSGIIFVVFFCSLPRCVLPSSGKFVVAVSWRNVLHDTKLCGICKVIAPKKQNQNKKKTQTQQQQSSKNKAENNYVWSCMWLCVRPFYLWRIMINWLKRWFSWDELCVNAPLTYLQPQMRALPSKLDFLQIWFLFLQQK